MKHLLNIYWKDILISMLLFSSTLLLFMYRLTEITPGMWGDEVGLGLMVHEVTTKHYFIPFLPFNYGHPTLLVYLSAVAIGIFGRSVFSLRIVSVIFGALSVGVFYLFCRLFFARFISLSTSFLFATSYVLIIVSRFAYEMSAAIFFFILAGIGIALLSRRKTVYAALLIGISSALGLYTYLAFRSLIPILLGISCIIIFRQKLNRARVFAALLISFLIISLPLMVYGFQHPDLINARVNALSVFNQHLPTSEVIKELEGASMRTMTMFGFTQDPNPRQNPGSVPPFDIITSFLFLAGLIYLWIKKRALAAFLTLLFAGILIAEVVTLERIPDFHYYGLGHPNTLRIALLAPLVVFCIGWSFQVIEKHFTSIKYFLVSILVALIAMVNLYSYFGQTPNQWIYTTNFVIPLRIIDILNTQNPNQVALSPTLYNLQHIQYFLHPNIRKIKIAFDCTQESLPKGISVLLAQDLSTCSAQALQMLTNEVTYEQIKSPWNNTDAVIFRK